MKTKDLQSATDSNFRLPRAVEVLFGVAAVAFIVTAIFSRATGTDAMNQQYGLADYAKLVLSGNLLPRWIPTGFKGAGAPSFYFYPPLPFWLAAPISAITGVTSASGLFQIESLLAAVGWISLVALAVLLLLAGREVLFRKSGSTV